MSYELNAITNEPWSLERTIIILLGSKSKSHWIVDITSISLK